VLVEDGFSGLFSGRRDVNLLRRSSRQPDLKSRPAGLAAG
jgi:hypothetical protein